MAIVYSHLTVSLTKENSDLMLEMLQGDTGRGLIVFVSDDVIVDEPSETDSSLTATLLKIHSEDSKFKDIKLLRDLKKQGFFKKIPSIATIKDILDNCEVTE